MNSIFFGINSLRIWGNAPRNARHAFFTTYETRGNYTKRKRGWPLLLTWLPCSNKTIRFICEYCENNFLFHNELISPHIQLTYAGGGQERTDERQMLKLYASVCSSYTWHLFLHTKDKLFLYKVSRRAVYSVSLYRWPPWVIKNSNSKIFFFVKRSIYRNNVFFFIK